MPNIGNIQSVKPLVEAIQKGLAALGFDPGPIDGILGARTKTAIREYRVSIGLLNPVGAAISILEPAMLAGLFVGEKPDVPTHDAPWVDIGWRKLLQHEELDNRSLWDWLALGRSANKLGDPSRHPWCGDFVETCISQALDEEALPGLPYLARDWLKFGAEIDGPAVGAVVVFYRGDRNGSSGHVGFYISEDSNNYHILGGNQKNRVSVTRIAKSRTLGYRWPFTYPFAGENRVIADRGGTVSVNEA